TRLRKLADHQVDALVLAVAGLQRLGREQEADGLLDEFVPAAGQGALALQSRKGELDQAPLASLIDKPSMACVGAERALVHTLGASCNTPVGAHARAAPGGRLELTAWVGLPDGSAWLRDCVCEAPAVAGALCAERMLAAGACELLQ